MESRVSMDAAGVPPRQEQHAIEFAPEPPINWRLNVLLEDIASKIQNAELNRIRILFRGPGGLGKGTLEKCDTFTKLFDVLRERCFISRGNITYLDKILYTLNRPDLIERAARYCREEGNVVHYYKEELNEDGFTRVKIHIVTDIRNIDMETIGRLRYDVAKIACAPLEAVRIASVEPGSSLLVTLLIPDIYATILQKLLDDELDLWELTAVGADTVVIGDKCYNLSGIHEAEMVETDQQRKFMNIYEQLEQTRQELRNTETQAIERKEEIHKLQVLLKQHAQHEIDMKMSIELLERKNKELSAACSSLERSSDGKAAMSSFRHALSVAYDKHQEEINVVKRIVEANTSVVSAFIQNLNEAERKQKEAERTRTAAEKKQNEAVLKEMRSKESEIFNQLLTRKCTAKEALYTKYARYTLSTPLTLNETPLDVMKVVGEHLTDEERKHLMELYDWEVNDLIKTCIELDKSLLFIGLECKEAEKTQKAVQSDVFLKSVLRQVNRPDLELMYVEQLSNMQSKVRQDSIGLLAQIQSTHQSTIFGHITMNELHQIHATTTATLDIVKQVYGILLKGPSTMIASDSGSSLLLRSFQSHPKLHPMPFPFVSHYAHQFGIVLKTVLLHSFSK